jgi:hypothetical protein
MLYIKIDYTDGQYSATLVPNKDGPDVYPIQEGVYEAYVNWLNQGQVFDALFNSMENERETLNWTLDVANKKS